MKRLATISRAGACLALLAFWAGTAVADPDPFGSKFNNYQCYEVTAMSGSVVDHSVKVADQFAKYGQNAARLLYLCNPVSLDGEPIAAKEVHLACFLTDPSGTQNLEPQTVFLKNRFGKQKVALAPASRLLCVTTTKSHKPF